MVERKLFAASGRPAWLVVLGATIIGAALRLFHIDTQSLWLDEVSSLIDARAFGSGGLPGLARADQVAPLHAIVLWIATALGGDSAVSLRTPSVLAGIATIPLIAVMSNRLFTSRWIGAIAAVLIALSPYAVWYSQEGRMYALLLLCAIAFAILSWPVVERALHAWELLALTMVTTIGFGMHHYMILMTGAFGLFLLVEGRALKPRTWAWLATQVVALLIFAGWLYLTRDRLGNVAGTEKPSFALWIPYTFYTYVVGFSFGPTTRQIQEAGQGLGRILVQQAPFIVLAAVSVAVLLAAAALHLTRPAYRRAGRWLLIWVLAPILIAVIATRVTNIRYNVRYVIVCYPALMLLFAVAIERAGVHLATLRATGTRDRAITIVVGAAAATLVGCMIWSLVNLYTAPRYAKEDVRTLATRLNALPRDVLLASDNNRVVKVLDYYHGRVPAPSLQVDYRLDTLTPPLVWRNLVALERATGRPVALIEYRSWEADPDHLLRSCLEANSRPIGSAEVAGAKVTLYRAFTSAISTHTNLSRCG